MNLEIIKELEKFPPLPKTINDLKIAYEDENVSAKEIEDIIKKDPLLVADILKFSNSAYFGFIHEIYDLRHAITLLGFDEIVNFAILASLKNSFKIDLSFYGIDEKDFIKLSLKKSDFNIFKDKNRESLFKMAAFLSDIGKIVISKFAKDKDLSINIEDNLSLIEIDHLEKNLFDADTIDISSAIFENWNFDKRLIDIIISSKECLDNEIGKYLYTVRENINIKGKFFKDKKDDCKSKELFGIKS